MTDLAAVSDARPSVKVNLNIELTTYQDVNVEVLAKQVYGLLVEKSAFIPDVYSYDAVDVTAAQSVEEFFADAVNGRRPVVLEPR